jgi:hypothetical protein
VARYEAEPLSGPVGEGMGHDLVTLEHPFRQPWNVLNGLFRTEYLGAATSTERRIIAQPDPELLLHSCYVSVTIQLCIEVPHVAKCRRHFHLAFNTK